MLRFFFFYVRLIESELLHIVALHIYIIVSSLLSFVYCYKLLKSIGSKFPNVIKIQIIVDIIIFMCGCMVTYDHDVMVRVKKLKKC